MNHLLAMQVTLKFPCESQFLGCYLHACPCGFYGSRDQRECTCTPQQIQKYRAKLSGPLLDRIDLHLEVPRVPVTLQERPQAESSEGIRRRGEAARVVKCERYRHRPGAPFNSAMNGEELRRYAGLDREGQKLLQLAFETLGLSARANQIVKVARTIADLAGAEQSRSRPPMWRKPIR
ncbi:ATP-binding protein [Brevibacillus sp. LEMMJ03]|uniref:magnesium chelatase subunit ChlI family protein n=1 Tax=Brevibacillus sp. LEMMJ03 TaxID=2595056 RepID=UPI0021025A37|nr:ATP-binding protein [Brevibacillus sp. LEMMJ03]